MKTKFPNPKSVDQLIFLASNILKNDGSIRLGTFILAICRAKQGAKYSGLVRNLRPKFEGLEDSQQWRLYVQVLKGLNSRHGPLDCSLTAHPESHTTWRKADPNVPAAHLVIQDVLVARTGSLMRQTDARESVWHVCRLREASEAAFNAYSQSRLLLKEMTVQVLLA